MLGETVGGSLEVAVLPGNPHCRPVGEIRKAELAPEGSLLCSLGLCGRLEVLDPADREAPPAVVDGSYEDFYWEKEAVRQRRGGGGSDYKLLALGSHWDLKLLQVETEPGIPVSVFHVSECPPECLLQTVRDKDTSVSELQSLHLLSFSAGRCHLLLNNDWLLQLEWQEQEDEDEEEEKEEEEEEEALKLSCCRVELSHSQPAVHLCVCRETLFILTASGDITVHNLTDGIQLARLHLPAYLCSGAEEDQFTSSLFSSSSSSSSPFCLLQVSVDLSTAVAVTQSNSAVAVDLNHYFRVHPDHLLCATPRPRPPLGAPQPGDPDSLSNSNRTLTALGGTFNPDRSLEARLASMYHRVQSAAAPSSPHAVASCWWSSLPGRDLPLDPSLSHSRVPPGGAVATFSVPASSTPSQLTVSQFTAMLTFITPSNSQISVALWDIDSQSVMYHCVDGEAAPVQRCGERQHRLMLKKTGLFQVLFALSQQDLLSKLMLFCSASTVDAVCHLNSWGRCSVPIHALQAGLKNRQLDTVDFYLKSKENLLDPSEQPAGSSVSLADRVQELCPALDLLCSTVRDSNSEPQSRQFSEQLLNITTSFVNTQIRTLLSHSQYEDSGVQSCVAVLDCYINELRSYMKKFPWSAGRQLSTTRSVAPSAEEEQTHQWDKLSVEEVVRQSILTNQLPRAQALLRRRGQAEHSLSAVRTEGLRQVFSCLQLRDLQTAKTLLTNMGFNVKKELHNICRYTDDKHLRETMVEELSRQSYFPEEEMKSVVFIREMENLRLLPPVHCAARTDIPRGLRMNSAEGGSEEVLKEVLEENRTTDEEEGGQWLILRLDWVRNMDQSCQSAILLSRLQHSELRTCESSVLWCYMTALHDQQRVVNWIQNSEASSPTLWPKLTPELVNNNTMCSTYMRENILDLLARRGVFIPEELADLEQLLWRLVQGGGVMASHPPISHYRTPLGLGLDLHSLFISLCLCQSLQYLLYCYLEHYRLTPRNCPLLTNQSLSESQPWFEMLVRVQEITRDLSDPGLVFQASLTTAQVLLAGSQASLSSLLLEGHSLLALAATMFAPGGIDQVMAWGKRSRRSESMVDPQLLKMALAPYPKLKAALFPTGPRGASQPSDISIYHLLQSLPPLDPSRLFGWQVANTFNSGETSEPPHFSSPHMVERFALVENLDFLYYLRHGRPSFAFATFLVQQLFGCSDVQPLLQVTFQQVYCVALECFHTPSVTSAAVCFCELLGVCSLKLRVDVRVLNAILQHRNQQQTHLTPTVHLYRLVTKGVKLVEADHEAAEGLIGDLEAAVTDSLEQRGIIRSSYEAAQEWALPVQFCQLHGLRLSSVYLSHCAQDKHFIHFLLFVQLHNFPAQQVRSLAAEFGPTLRAHLSMAFQDLQVYNQKKGCGSEELSTSVSIEESARRPEQPRELFQILLQSQEEPMPCRYLLQEALLQCCPTLAVLTSCLQASELLPCLCVWVLTSVDDLTAAEATAHLPDAPEYHDWSLHDLSIIWRTLLGRGLVRPLLRGFELFQRDCPLVLVLRMFELCCDYRNFTEAKSKLLDFQRTLIALRNSVPATEGVLPLQWVESQASVLLLAMLQHCSSQYDLHRLLQLLADVDKLLKSNGPDFRRLSQLSQLLQGSEVSLSPRLLQCSSTSVQQEEYQAAVDALQSQGVYGKARQVAQLAGLPVHRLLLSQLHQEMNSQKSKHQWGKLEARLSFWLKCHDQLVADCTDPHSAAHFFLSQADAGICQAQMELLDIEVRCLLLHLAAHWLALLCPAPRAQLESLEKKLWQSRVRKHLLTVAMEKETVFNLPPPATAPDVNTYEVLAKRFSFSNIPELNTEESLSLEGLPGPSEPQVDLDPEAVLAPEERSVLAAMVGQLLDEGSIHEASRVCRYFLLYHPDMWLVLRCRGLASGELKPEPPQEEVPETPAGRSISSSHSFSSLSSFVMLPLPEDEVAVQLHRLVEQCCHGNNYCKQVLGLYQLSKELQCSFSQVCAEDPSSVLQKLLQLEQVERFRKAQAFIRAQGLSSDTVAQLVSSTLVQGLLASTQELHPEEKLVFRPSEGRDSLVQLIKLCDDPNLVGVKLLENLSTVPLRDLNCIVELLIVAHDCFSLTCNMEGIVRVLQAARHLSHTYLAPGEQYSLLVRLLTGIGRYNEMTYIFDLLHQNHCFEMLLRKKVDTERGQSSSLKTALLDYIKRCLPADSEKHNMVALCFSMRREIGENHEMAARTQLKMIESQAWVVTPDLNASLVKVLNLLKDAAESFSKDSCVRQATRCVRTAKLVALQLHFLNQGSGLRIINLQTAELLNTTLSLPRCYQVLVVSEAYSHTPDWAEILYQKVILNGDFVYLEEFKQHRLISATLFEDIFRKLDSAPSSVTSNVKRLLIHCEDVYSRYRLAYQQNLYDVTKTLLQDVKTSNYLKDRLAS